MVYRTVGWGAVPLRPNENGGRVGAWGNDGHSEVVLSAEGVTTCDGENSRVE